MTMKSMNRSHRIFYLVVLLVFAVALSTALMLAGERSAEDRKQSNLEPSSVPAWTHATNVQIGGSNA